MVLTLTPIVYCVYTALFGDDLNKIHIKAISKEKKKQEIENIKVLKKYEII